METSLPFGLLDLALMPVVRVRRARALPG